MEEVRDRGRLAALLRREPVWAGYALGDLDDAQLPRTRWFARGDALALLYAFGGHTTLMTFGAAEPVGPLFDALPLPPRFHLHLPEWHRDALHPRVEGTLGAYVRLGLGPDELRCPPAPGDVRPRQLRPGDVPAARDLYAHYPGNWFDARRVEEGCYLGLWAGDALLAVGGTHVVSAQYRVAALGDIVTDPDQRGRGLATFLTAELCRRLFASVELIVLNYKADNAAAERTYAKVGFAHPVPHDEGFDVTRRG